MVTGGQTGQIPEIDPGNTDATSTPATTSFMGFTILIVRRWGLILCKGQRKSCGFPGPKSGIRGTRHLQRPVQDRDMP
jgi:hypothetical protein